MLENETIGIDLLPGERLAILHLLNNFKAERPSSVMRKVKRAQHAIAFKQVMKFTIDKLLDDEEPEAIPCEFPKTTLEWLWDTFGKFTEWPSVLAEWVVDVEDKLRVAQLKATGAAED